MENGQESGATSVAEPVTQTEPVETTSPEQTTDPATPAQPVVQKGGLKVPIPKPKSRFNERISTLVGDRERTEAENRQLRDRLAKYENNGQPLTPRTGQAPAAAATAPDGSALKPEDFDTYEEYIQALVSRSLENAAKKQQSQAGETAVAQHRAQRMESFQEAAAPLIEEHGEAFMEAITDPSLPVTDAMADAVLELDEIGPFVMLYLASHPTECLKIAKMNPRASTVAIGRLASRLDYEIRQGGEGNPPAGESTTGGANTPAPSVGTQPSRPAPTTLPTPRGGSPAQLDATPSDKMDTRQWMLAEAERLRKKYGPNTRTWVPR